MGNKYQNWIKKACIFMAATIGACILIPGTVLAEPVEHERLMEQLTKAFAEGEVYEVKQDGSGDFTTIQEGVNAAVSGDTLLIYPGVYDEIVGIYNKTVHLLGTDKEQCIIQYDSSKYSMAPLSIGAGNVANLTIYGYRPEDAEAEKHAVTSTKVFNNDSEETIEVWQSKFPGYAVHIDQDYSFGNDIVFENCRIMSNNNQCVGIGSRGYNDISFIECELYSNGIGGCIYFHNSPNINFAGETQFILKDCILKNYKCPYLIAMHSFGIHNPVYLTFQNVEVSTVAYERKGVYGSSNMNILFDVDSLKSLDTLNLLKENGLYSSMDSEMVTEYNDKDSFQYIKYTRNLLNISDPLPELAEGISYMQMIETEREYTEAEKKEEVRNRKRQVIDIYNNTQLSGLGWCGLEGIYLTPESYGNTLIEMNYPKLVMLEETLSEENILEENLFSDDLKIENIDLEEALEQQ